MIISAKSKYHKQSRDNYCGAASAMMILADGFKMDPANINQEDIYKAASKGADSQWHIDPDGLSKVLSDLSKSQFVVNAPSAGAAALRQIVAALIEYDVPPAVTILKNDHWVLVNAVEVDGDPKEGDFAVRTVFYHDPSCSYICPQKHKVGDGCPSNKADDIPLTYEGWEKFFDAAEWGVHKDVYPNITQSITREIGDIKRPDKSIFSWSSIGDSVESLFQARLLLDGSTLLLKGIELVGPEYVRRLDRKDSDYLLFGYKVGGEVVAQVMVSADQGESEREAPLLSFRLTDRDSRASSVFSEVGLVADQSALLAQLKHKPDVRLVWAPCPESSTPFLPFYELDGIISNESKAYMRVDGLQSLSRLSADKKGG